MVEVRLHGALAQSFGRVWDLDIATPVEAVRAIDAARRGFRQAIMRLANAGMVFRVRTKTHDYDSEDVGATLGHATRLDIIPIVAGASAGVRFVMGAVLVAVGVLASGLTAGTSTTLVTMGASLMLGSVVEWLTPMPKRDDSQKSLQSWTISGPVNTADQGLPVPIIYGEVLTGGYTISAGIVAAPVSPGGSIDPSAYIGGEINPNAVASGGSITVVVKLSCGAYNLDDPLSYAWSFTGFAGATARRLTLADKSTMRLELDYTMTPNPTPWLPLITTDTGTVAVTVSGYAPASSPPTTTSVATSTPVTVTMNTFIPEILST